MCCWSQQLLPSLVLTEILPGKKDVGYQCVFQWTNVIMSELQTSQTTYPPVAQRWELALSDSGNRFVTNTAGLEEQ